MNQNVVIKSSLSINNVHENTQTSIIVITEDKLENLINKHLEGCLNKTSWQTPLSIFLAIITVFISSEFKDALGIEKSVWKSAFLISGALSFFWLMRNVHKLWITRKINTLMLITIIKNQSNMQTQTNSPPP